MTPTDEVARTILTEGMRGPFTPEQESALKEMAEYYLGVKHVTKLWGPIKALATVIGMFIGLWLSVKAGMIEPFIAFIKGGPR